jgi:hypothetical protein
LARHDWRKARQNLQEYLQAQRFSVEAEEVIRTLSPPANPAKSQPLVPTYSAHSSSNSHASQPFRAFSLELQNSLISKMSSPIEEVKKEAAERAIKIWEEIPRLSGEGDLTAANGWQEESIARFFNIIKCRLNDSTPEIVSLYCQLLSEMLRKGVPVKQRNMRSVVHTIFSNLSRGLPAVKELFREMVVSCPSHMFAAMQSEVLLEGNQPALIDFLNEHNELFIAQGDLKVFMAPFLHILCSSGVDMRHKQALDNLFHQMVEISGEEVLKRELEKMKVGNIEPYNQYLSKYELSLGKGNYVQGSGRNFQQKEDRLAYWQEEGWQFAVSSNHLLKLANMMITLGEPLSSLCNLFYLTPQQLREMDGFDTPTLRDYSDIFFKFVYWRAGLDSRETVDFLLRFVSKVVVAVNYEITEIDISTLMRTFIFVMERFKGEMEHEICEILGKLFGINSEIQSNTLPFWINSLNSQVSQPLTDQILSVLMQCYH